MGDDYAYAYPMKEHPQSFRIAALILMIGELAALILMLNMQRAHATPGTQVYPPYLFNFLTIEVGAILALGVVYNVFLYCVVEPIWKFDLEYLIIAYLRFSYAPGVFCVHLKKKD